MGEQERFKDTIHRQIISPGKGVRGLNHDWNDLRMDYDRAWDDGVVLFSGAEKPRLEVDKSKEFWYE